jgi:hypothetical protein
MFFSCPTPKAPGSFFWTMVSLIFVHTHLTLIFVPLATSLIHQLEATQRQMQAELTASNIQINQLQQIHAALVLNAAERRSSQDPL